MNATIVSCWRAGNTVTGSVRVAETWGTVEYVATVPAVDALGQALTAAQIRQLLAAAWQAARAAGSPPAPAQDLGAQINGQVTL